jgi:hypothetical protein
LPKKKLDLTWGNPYGLQFNINFINAAITQQIMLEHYNYLRELRTENSMDSRYVILIPGTTMKSIKRLVNPNLSAIHMTTLFKPDNVVIHHFR